MKAKTLYPLWGVFYIICVLLGAIPERNPVADAVLTAVSILFFVPPGLLLYACWKEKNQKWLRVIRVTALTVLIATVVLLLINLMSITLLLVMPVTSLVVTVGRVTSI